MTVRSYVAGRWEAPSGPTTPLLHAATAEALDDPTVRRTLEAQGVEVTPGTPDQLAAKLRAELALWARVVKEAGASVD